MSVQFQWKAASYLKNDRLKEIMFDKLEYFETILKYGTLSKASVALGISQPALSNYLKQIEIKSGASLFDRSSSPIVLTEAGKIYYKYLKQADSLVKEYINEVGDLGTRNCINITVGGASSTTAGYLSNVTAEFLEKYPYSRIKIIDGLVSDIARQTLNGEIDFFITPVNQKNSDFKYIKLLDERIFLCVPENVRKRVGKIDEYAERELEKKAISIEDFAYGRIKEKEYVPLDARILADSRFILLEEGTNIRTYTNSFFTRWNYNPKNPVEVTQMLTGFQMCDNGVGITFLPESILKNIRYKTSPYIYAIDEDISRRSMYVCYKNSRYLSDACIGFIDILRKYME